MKPVLSNLAGLYAWHLPEITKVAREHGYAIATHGSFNRDMDLIAVPWTAEATDALTLIKALKAATGTVTHTECADEFFPDCSPTLKPHGRVAYSLHFSNRGGEAAYIDISVMPRVTDTAPPTNAAGCPP
jgi:hypothetical protein